MLTTPGRGFVQKANLNMPTLPHRERKSSESLQPGRLAELDRQIASGKGDVDRTPPWMKAAERREAKAARMRDRIAARADIRFPNTELSRPIQLTLPGPPRKLAPSVAEALSRIDMGVVTVREFMTPGKGRAELTHVRRLVAFQLRARHKHLSLPEIGRLMGGLNHTSVLHLIRTCPERERRVILADTKREEERHKQEERMKSEPVDYNAWDEWI